MLQEGDRRELFDQNVLLAICPHDPELDYHELEEVYSGNETINVFPAVRDMKLEEREQTRQNLLVYCQMDTLVMVKVWDELRQAADL